jgi:Tfp pilus assembly protein PilO
MNLEMNPRTSKINKDTLVGTILPLVFFAATAGLVFLLTYPKYNEIQPKKDQLTQLETKRSSLEGKLAKLNDLVDYKEVVDQNSALINTALPSEANVPILLTQIQTIAKENGLEIQNLTYTSAGAKTQNEANKINVQMSAKGSFDQVRNFFYAIEKASRVLEFSTIRFSSSVSGNSTEATTKNAELEINVSLSSPYLFVESKATTEDPITWQLI